MSQSFAFNKAGERGRQRWVPF